MKSVILLLSLVLISQALPEGYDPSKVSHYIITEDKKILEIPSSSAEEALHMPGVVAVGSYSDQTYTQGWLYLSVNTSHLYPDVSQASLAGYFEGYMTYKYIYDSYLDLGPYDYSKDAFQYMKNQTAWVEDMIEANPNDTYWQLTNISFTQTAGIYEGYLEAAIRKGNESMLLSFEEFLWISYQFEISDIETRFPTEDYEPSPIYSQHCSFLLKLVEDDLYVSHTTWSGYVAMIRIYKNFNFGYTNPAIQNNQQAFSGAVGCICSGDDFYLLSNNRFVGETTVGSSNPASWDFLHYDSVPYFLRINTANLAYDTASTWMNYYFSYRSGTYNNQWLIIDFNNYLNNKNNLSKATDIIWMIEEFYAMTSAQDLTQSMLIPQGFVASYNEVYNPILQAYSMNSDNYTNAPRYMLFNKYAPGIKTFADFQTVMRMNNISDTGNYCDAIACRCDLEGPNGPGPFGAMDCKASAASMISSRDAYIISGPTTELTPPFSWNNWPTFANYSFGMDRTYNFTWQYAPGYGYVARSEIEI